MHDEFFEQLVMDHNKVKPKSDVFADFDPKIPEYPMLIYDIISIMA